jgi:peroxiredoxin
MSCEESLSFWPSILRTGARFAAIRWLSITRFCPTLKKFGAELVGISVDGAWCHAAYAKDHHLRFPLAADFEPKGAVSKAYGAYHQEAGFSERALFVINKDGVITWSHLSPILVNPGADGILQALEDLEK